MGDIYRAGRAKAGHGSLAFTVRHGKLTEAYSINVGQS